jgi:uncharacterized damage-inducible protein DinB
MTTESQYLVAWAAAVRESTLKRLRRVPEGHEHWRLSPQVMSFADLAQHIIDADAWLFQKLADRSLEPMVGRAGFSHITARSQCLGLLTRLQSLGADRERLIAGFTADQLAETVFDRRFGGEVTVWWVLVRGNLDHEVHHRGQISVYLRAAGIPPS